MSEWNGMISQLRQPEAVRTYPQVGWWTDPGPYDEGQLARFESTGLERIAALMDRYETKFVFHERRLDAILSALTGTYRVLEINETRLSQYRTLYFDSPDFALFRRHHAGGRNRYKVRGRRYLDSDLSFLEIKHKVKKNRTIKHRVEIDGVAEKLSADALSFLDAHLVGDRGVLEPKLWNDYTRITLVHMEKPERVTIDLNLKFRGRGETIVVPDVAVAEVKQARNQGRSDFTQLMKAERIRPTGFSKYCIGVSLLYPQIKHNRFKSSLDMMSKIIYGEPQYAI